MNTKIVLFTMLLFSLLSIRSIIQAESDLIPLLSYKDDTEVTYFDSSEVVMIPSEYTEKDEEVRAVWIATAYNLDVPKASSYGYEAAVIQLLDSLEEYNINTVFFQVRSFNDAYFDSANAPCSKYLFGTQGVCPSDGTDYLEFVIAETKKRNMEFHAWFNPYRVAGSIGTQTMSEYLQTLPDNNYAKMHPEDVIMSNDSELILNPAKENVKQYLITVIDEVLQNYDVDGIHFDDYFYPYSGIPSSADINDYNSNKLQNESIADYRRRNINEVVHRVSDLIHTYNQDTTQNLKFGISPFGIWKSGGEGSNTSSGTTQSYSDQYADSREWVTQEWLDYICPQVYWEFEHGTANYMDVVDWWVDTVKDTNVDLIIGHANYKYDINYQTDVPFKHGKEIINQLYYNQKYPEIKGSSFYSAKHIVYGGRNNFTQTLEFNEELQTLWTKSVDTSWFNEIDTDYPSISVSSRIINVEKGTTTTDFTKYFTITDYIDGTIDVLESMLTFDVTYNLNTIGSYTLTIDVTNSRNFTSTRTVQIIVHEADMEPPVITINGSSLMYIIQNETFEDLGVTVTDNYDTDIVAIIGGNIVDTTKEGTYIITYNAIDSTGNNAIEVTRTVVVTSEHLDNYFKIDNVLITSINVHEMRTYFINVDTIIGDSVLTTTGQRFNGLIMEHNGLQTTTSLVRTTDVAIWIDDYQNLSVDLDWGDQLLLINANGTILKDLSRLRNSVEVIALWINQNQSLLQDVEFAITADYSSLKTKDNFFTLNWPSGGIELNEWVISEVKTSSGYQFSIPGNTVDSEPPVITLIGESTITLELSDTYQELGVDITDNVDLNLQVNITGTVNTNTPGTYILRYNVTDNAGNEALETIRTVIVNEPVVIDVEPPVITLIGESTITLDFGEPYQDLGVDITDNIDQDLQVVITGTVDTNTPGTYIVKYNVRDKTGNDALEITRTVIINSLHVILDTTAPVITLSDDTPITINTGDNLIDVLPVCEAIDETDGIIECILIMDSDLNLQSGEYSITYKATDLSNNSSEKKLTIFVNDVPKKTGCSGDIGRSNNMVVIVITLTSILFLKRKKSIQ